MTISDEQLVRAVRDDVARRPAAGVPIEEVLRAGRRQVTRRRAVAGGVLGVLAVVAVTGSVAGVPLLTSAPPAAPRRSRSAGPGPHHGAPAGHRHVRHRRRRRPGGGASVVRRHGQVGVAPERASRPASHPAPRDDVVAGTSGPGYQVSTAHLTVAPDPGATSCAQVSQVGLECVREPQDDGSVLFELRVEGELAQYLLLHRSGFVRVDVMGPLPPEARPADTVRAGRPRTAARARPGSRPALVTTDRTPASVSDS